MKELCNGVENLKISRASTRFKHHTATKLFRKYLEYKMGYTQTFRTRLDYLNRPGAKQAMCLKPCNGVLSSNGVLPMGMAEKGY
jgi:hypothetical protein